MKVSKRRPSKDTTTYKLLALGCILTLIGPILLMFFTEDKVAWVSVAAVTVTITGLALVIYSWRKLRLKFSKLIELLFSYGIS